ncbi:MAG: metal-dependent hydrolase, partial [Candidatus Sumerlaeia bacterium]|nr:metal-dependent hydrolase [Candidatus Sumerlaeia bacterium]
MDFVTHTLAGVSTARLFSNQPGEVKAIGLTVILGSLLPDMDVCVYWISPEGFGRLHRTITHSVMGMIVISILTARISQWVCQREWLKYIPLSYFIPGAGSTAVSRPLRWHRSLLFSAWATSLHFFLDWITGWGITPLWPWSGSDFSLHAVNSFDWFIFLLTLGFWSFLHLILRPAPPQQSPQLTFARFAGGVYFLIIS